MASKSSASKIQLDDILFGSADQPSADSQPSGEPHMLLLDDLHPFPKHPFKMYDDARMDEMVESVKAHGVLMPILVRPRENGGYEIVAGHNRAEAAALAGLEKIPATIREMDDETATIIMVDSNLRQREQLMPSEKAFAYRMKLEAIRRQAGRPKDNCDQVGHNFDGKKSVEIIADESPDSRNQIQRFVRLTYLIQPLLDRVDNKQMAFSPAVAVSYLSEQEQYDLLEVMEVELASPSLEQAESLKAASQAGMLTRDSIFDLMREVKPNQREKAPVYSDRIRRFFPNEKDPKKMEDHIVKALEFYHKHRQRQQQQR